jgi:hypothetical protein
MEAGSLHTQLKFNQNCFAKIAVLFWGPLRRLQFLELQCWYALDTDLSRL